MEKKYFFISLDDEKAKKLADILGNKTCKNIIDILTEKEASEKEIADKLRIPINTVEYNLKKLLAADLIEKSKNYFWSQKGKKIDMYKVSNKSIIISPKNKITSGIRSILPVAVISGIAAIGLRYYFSLQSISNVPQTNDLALKASETAVSAAPILTCSNNVWLWFLTGALFGLVVFMILNYKNWR
jgi:DNA-binding transcriptional ArsR family regulator